MIRDGPDTAPLVVAHLSDLHLGAHDPAAVNSVAADVAAAEPALTVVTGDLTMRARSAEFAAARRLLDRLPRPLLVVTGNHDVPLWSPARMFSPYAGYRRWITAELDPLLLLPGLTALGLQSMPRWRWKGGRISRRQAGEVRRVLGAAPADGVRLLALHHPPFAPGPAAVVGRGRLERALAATRTDIVLAGHTHLPVVRGVEVRDGAEVHHLVEVIAGTATSRRTRGAGRSWSAVRIDPAVVVVQERCQGDRGWHPGRRVSIPRRSG